jgi:uncharacterized membrane protein YbhN (UPF0104 family)
MLKIVLKVSISFLLIGFLLSKINLDEMVLILKRVSFLWGFVTIASIWLSLVLISFRWQAILTILTKKKIPLSVLFKLVFVGFFFNQGLPSTIGGDIYRMIALKKYDISKKNTVTSVIMDRFFGLIALLLLAFIGFILNWELLKISNLKNIFILSSVVILSFVTLFILFSRLKKDLLPKLNFILEFAGDFVKLLKCKPLKIFTISSLSMFISILPFYWISIDLNISLSMVGIFTVVPIVFLAGALPISFAGWGMREGLLAFLLKFYSVPTEQALAISILFGIFQLFAALPALALYLTNSKAKL